MTVIFLIIKTFLSKLLAAVISAIQALVHFVRENPKTTACIVGGVLIAGLSGYVAYNKGVASQQARIESLDKLVLFYKQADTERKDKIAKLEIDAKLLADQNTEANEKNKKELDSLVKTYETKLAAEKLVSKVIRVPYTVEVIKEGKTITMPQEYSVFVGPDNKPYCDRLSNSFLATVNDILRVNN
jgi:hypothetical protein